MPAVPMSLTRRVYLALSAALRSSKLEPDATAPQQHQANAEAVAGVLGDGNPAFDRARFLKDSGARVTADDT